MWKRLGDGGGGEVLSVYPYNYGVGDGVIWGKKIPLPPMFAKGFYWKEPILVIYGSAMQGCKL